MSMWQFDAAITGWAKQYETDDGKMSSTEADDMWAWLQEKTGGVKLTHTKQ